MSVSIDTLVIGWTNRLPKNVTVKRIGFIRVKVIEVGGESIPPYLVLFDIINMDAKRDVLPS